LGGSHLEERMLEIAVIADDLTGAADTGVQFCPYFRKTMLTSYRGVSRLSSVKDQDALSVYTNTRALKAQDARERLKEMTGYLAKLHPKMIYKKVDSSLRGNLGAEVDVIVEQMGFDLSFIAPAFPDMGRTTLHDKHLIHGTPVAETELSRDPVTPVTESRLSHIVAGQCRHEVGHVDVRFMDDDDTLRGEIQRLVECGARHLTFDTTCNEHLVRIAHLALGGPMKVLLVGSAGLAKGLASHFQKRPGDLDSEPPGPPKGHHLLICGTVSERTRRQLAELIKTYCYEIIALSPRTLADPAMRNELMEEASLAQKILAQNHLIVQVEPPETKEPCSPTASSPVTAQKIVGGLGLLVASILKNKRPASLFLSGGDTADAVLEVIGATGIRLRKEIVQGVPYGTLIGGPVQGLLVITKAGAFGGKDTLVKVHEYWLSKRLEE
jgi:uncharacterized protein YgbK (DUF1537 family)